MKNAYKTLIGKHEGKRYLGRTKNTNGRIMITICLKYLGNKDMNCIQQLRSDAIAVPCEDTRSLRRLLVL